MKKNLNLIERYISRCEVYQVMIMFYKADGSWDREAYNRYMLEEEFDEGYGYGEEVGEERGKKRGIAIGKKQGIAIGKKRGISIGEKRCLKYNVPISMD
ncbi:MAG TPA: hypothetical protein DHU33_06365, partial [Firmicutes bacterium]|nr:hypothetical protein [Bacillota bacterium]